jgi:LysR family transcriptional regulator, low CO2-responsive transcriptional regulator
MNFDQLRSFVAFAEQLNFTRAAERLHISQPALHVQIRKLAEAVGRPLYRREGRALALTAEGERLAAFGREVDVRGREVLAEVRGETLTGPVVLAAGQGALLYLLGAALRRFPKDRHPLRVLALPGPEAIRAVRDARAHAAVAAVASAAVPEGLSAVKLRDVSQHVVVPAGHRVATRRYVHAADLAGEDIIVAPSGTPHRALVAHALGTTRWQVAVEATGWELMLELARSGLGIAVVNDFCPPGRGMVAVPLRGVAAVTYRFIERSGFSAPATETLRRLVTESVFR